MKHSFLFISIAMTTMMFSQNYNKRWSEKDPADYVYFNGSFDANMAFGLKDNTDTAEFDDRGFDFDVELGGRDRHFGVYIFYGRFNPINYQNYGAGVDYYVKWLRETELIMFNPFNGRRVSVFDGIELSVGGAYGVIIRDNNFTFPGSHFRSVATIWFGKDLGFTMRFQLVQAGDLPNKKFRKEGSIGFTYKIDRK